MLSLSRFCSQWRYGRLWSVTRAMKMLLAVSISCSFSNRLAQAQDEASYSRIDVLSTKSEHHQWVGKIPNPPALGSTSDCTFIFTHGLFGDAKQFKHYAESFRDYECSSLLLTLPGHALDSHRSEQVRTVDWIRFLNRALISVATVSERIYLVGQSTGGALSLVAAAQNPDLVAGLWLIEPALRVRSAPHLGACLFSLISDDIRNWPQTAKQFGVAITEHSPKLSPRMGCLVDTIWSDFLVSHNRLKYEQKSDYYEKQSATVDMISRLKTPIFIQNTIDDKMVDWKFLKEIFQQNSYVQSAKHGSLEYSEKASVDETTPLPRQHGAIVLNNPVPVREIENLIKAGFKFSPRVLRKRTVGTIEALQKFAEFAVNEYGRVALFEQFLAKARELPQTEMTVECLKYLELVTRVRGRPETKAPYELCINSLNGF